MYIRTVRNKHYEASMMLPFLLTLYRDIFVDQNLWILIKLSLRFVPKDPIDNKTLDRRQAITWTNDHPVQWRLYASHAINELKLRVRQT